VTQHSLGATTIDSSDLTIYSDPNLFLVATMSLLPHESYRATISVDPTASSPAPIQEGKPRGYFDDEATRKLLGLEMGTVPLHSGTYGDQEPGAKPVKFSLLRQRLPDVVFLPFVPKNHWFHYTPISMHETNRQYLVHKEARRELDRLLSKALIDAQAGAKETGLLIPDYARHLVPKLRYKKGGDGEPFFYQFQIFFSPSAHRIRAARIGRVCAILDALSNVVQTLQGDPGEYEKGNPVGILWDVDELTDDDLQLLTAYRSMDVSVEGSLPEGLPPLVSVEQARMILFGKSKERAVTTKIDDKDSLSDDDDDALYYARIQPDHDDQGFNADGKRKTVQERQDEAEEAAAQEYIAEREEAATNREEPTPMDVDPAPPYSPPEPGSREPFGTSALQVSLGETGSSSGTPLQVLTPVSAATSLHSSEAASVNSSASASSAQPGQQRRSTVSAQRSRNWRGRPRQPLPSGSHSPATRYRSPSPRRQSPTRRRSPSPRDYSPRRRQYSPTRSREDPHRYSSHRYSPRRRSPSPDQYPRRRSPPRQAAVSVYTQGMLAGLPAGAMVVQAHQHQQLVHETDSGILASVPVVSFSASQNTIRLPPPSSHYSPSRQIEDARSFRPRQSSRSPPREYHHRRLSPPRDSRRSSSQYSPPRGTRQFPPTDQRPRQGRRQPPPRQDPMDSWNTPGQNTTPMWGETPILWGNEPTQSHTSPTSVAGPSPSLAPAPVPAMPAAFSAPSVSPSAPEITMTTAPANVPVVSPAATSHAAITTLPPSVSSAPAPAPASAPPAPHVEAAIPAPTNGNKADSSAPGPSNPS
jgi:hypothetical protein